jgi:hypothetical protein
LTLPIEATKPTTLQPQGHEGLGLALRVLEVSIPATTSPDIDDPTGWKAAGALSGFIDHYVCSVGLPPRRAVGRHVKRSLQYRQLT